MIGSFWGGRGGAEQNVVFYCTIKVYSKDFWEEFRSELPRSEEKENVYFLGEFNTAVHFFGRNMIIYIYAIGLTRKYPTRGYIQVHDGQGIY